MLAPAALLFELRLCQRDQTIIEAQQQALDARAENVALRKNYALREVGRVLGLQGRLRLDLETGVVEQVEEVSHA